MSGLNFFDPDPSVLDQEWQKLVQDSIRAEVARTAKAINAGVEEQVIPLIAAALAERGYTVRPPIAAGDTMRLTGSGWENFEHPSAPGTSMLNATITVEEIIPGGDMAGFARFTLGGETFNAPTHLGALCAVTPIRD